MRTKRPLGEFEPQSESLHVVSREAIRRWHEYRVAQSVREAQYRAPAGNRSSFGELLVRGQCDAWSCSRSWLQFSLSAQLQEGNASGYSDTS